MFRLFQCLFRLFQSQLIDNYRLFQCSGCSSKKEGRYSNTEIEG
ncbi:hypothetical protein fHeYen801_068 [Yersinia phage fHe-Yen8-01]|nr:hypothetical protein fHeYen801_068 [Yersinia phage fHe-Yen8-01]